MNINEKNKLNQSITNLTNENERLKLQIDLLIAKIYSLEIKTEELTKIIQELQDKKKQLTENITNLENLQKEKDEVITMAVHDIKNPAGTIQNLVNLLESYNLNATEQKEIHKSLITISNRIVKIVDEVANTVRKAKVAFEIKYRKFDINEIIGAVVSRYLAVFQSKQINLVNNSEKMPAIEMDPDKIEDAIENLLNNALKFSPKGTTVTIQTSIKDEHAVVEVLDNGPGLSENDIIVAFEKGSKLSVKPTSGESSSGLGLWIVKRIIDEHSGRVWVRSKKGKGSTFAFRIPLEQKKQS
jgi:signal transduction histidine kinase